MRVGMTGAVPAAMHGLSRIDRYEPGLFVSGAFLFLILTSMANL